MCNICKIRLPQAIGDVISSIGIGIGTAAADSIGYRALEWYRSNPSDIWQENIRGFLYYISSLNPETVTEVLM